MASHDNGECEERLQFETLLTELSSRFVNIPADRVDAVEGRLQHQTPGEAESVVMGVTVDITERKQAEQELRQALHEVQRLRDRLQNENLYLPLSLGVPGSDSGSEARIP